MKTEGGVSVIIRSADYESAHYALALASAALAVNKPAVLFFTMGGLRALMVQRGNVGAARPPSHKMARCWCAARGCWAATAP